MASQTCSVCSVVWSSIGPELSQITVFVQAPVCICPMSLCLDSPAQIELRLLTWCCRSASPATTCYKHVSTLILFPSCFMSVCCVWLHSLFSLDRRRWETRGPDPTRSCSSRLHEGFQLRCFMKCPSRLKLLSLHGGWASIPQARTYTSFDWVTARREFLLNKTQSSVYGLLVLQGHAGNFLQKLFLESSDMLEELQVTCGF